MQESGEITQLLWLAQHGNRSAEARVAGVLTAELRRLAGGYLNRFQREWTLQPTALVNEVYLRLLTTSKERNEEWQNRSAFLANAGTVMRRVLADSARARLAEKRGITPSIGLEAIPTTQWRDEFLDVDAALKKLEKVAQRQARVVEMRFFAGLTESEIGQALGISERTVKRDWGEARDWLRKELKSTIRDSEQAQQPHTTGDLFDSSRIVGWMQQVPIFSPRQTLVGRFEIIRLLGRGGVGEVYEAIDKVLDVRVAIKTIRFEKRADPFANESFLREIKAAHQVAHPNVCRLYDLFTTQTNEGVQVPFLTMELLDGDTLDTYIRKNGPLSGVPALAIAEQICSGLESIHRVGLVHGDLKSANIFVSAGPEATLQARITDFGLTQGPDVGNDKSAIFGTPGYMAPELFEGSKRKGTSDIYSLGVVLYYLGTGRYPFEGDQRSTKRRDPVSPRYFVPDFPSTWERAILSCLSPDPNLRPPSAVEVAKILRKGTSRWKRSVSRRNHQTPEITIEWQVVLSGSVDELNPTEQGGIIEELRKAASDKGLVITRIHSGSIVLRLRGSEEGYRIFESLFRAGKLTEVHGLSVEEVSLVKNESSQPKDLLLTDRSNGEHGYGVFLSYAHEDAKWCKKLCTHLAVLKRQGLITTWYDREIWPGEVWEEAINTNLIRADIILLLISPAFLASPYCYGIELKKALERHNSKEARIVPVIIRPSDWKRSAIGELQALPTDGRPVAKWSNKDEAMNIVTQELRALVEAWKSGS